MPEVDPFPIIALDPDWVLDDEAMGSKDKKWFMLPSGERWLFKFSRVNEGVPTGEHWAEKVVAEVAALLGLPHAQVELAEFSGRVGSLSRRFPELSQPGVELIHGNDLLAGFVLGYEREKRFRQGDHTLENILMAVARAIPEEQARLEAMTTLAGFIVLDALVLNTDRHHENWALLRRTSHEGQVRHWVAPSFDHASSLGRELTDARLTQWEQEPWRPAWYAKRAHGAIYLKDSGDHGEQPLKLLEVACRWRPRQVVPWLDRVLSLNFDSISGMVARVPDGMMSARAKRFATALLQLTHQQLGSLV